MLLRQIGLIIALFSILGISASGVGLKLEERDAFCASCHTEPELTYYQRSLATGEGGDLAAFHAQLRDSVRCIGCHGGVGPAARIQTLFELGARDTVQYLFGQYRQPARTTQPLPNINCQQCHQSAVEVPDFENHFHNKLLQPAAPPILCVSCHLSHKPGEHRRKFIFESDVYPACNDCHKVMGGPTNLR